MSAREREMRGISLFMKSATTLHQKRRAVREWPFGRALMFLVLFGLLLFAPRMSCGQSDSFSIGSWGTRDGLPEMSVQSLALDPAGGLFVGTAGGLCFFDGSYCKPLQNQELRKVPASNLTVLLRQRDHSLWAGTEGGGLLHITVDRVEVFDQRAGLSEPYVRALFEDSTGRLWVGTDDGLFWKDGPFFQRMPLPRSAAHQAIYAIAEDSEHRLITGGAELVDLDALDPRLAHAVEVPAPYPVRSLLLARDGSLIVGTLGGAFARTGSKFDRLPIPLGDVERLCQSADGALWVGTVASGLWRMMGASASRVLLGKDDPGHSILAMASDASGRLWVGTEAGLSRVEPTHVHLIQSPASAVDSETLALSPQGTILLVNRQAYRIDADELQPMPFHLPGKPRILLNLLYGSDHTIWFGTAGNGVFHADASGHFTQYSTYSQLRIAGDFPRGVIEGVNREVWVATRAGVNKIGSGGISQFGTSDGLPSTNVRALLRDKNGCMWIGTDAGPTVYCNGHFVENRATRTLGGEEISAMAEDAKGTMWLGTRNHGIYAYRDSEVRHFSTSDGLLSNFVSGLAADGNGTLWISSPDAISSMPVDQPLGEHPNDDLVFARSYPLPQGAEGLRFGGARFPNVQVDARGVVWFASTRGPVYIDRAAAQSNLSLDAPIPVITSVLADNSYIQKDRLARIPSGSKLTFTFSSIYLGSDQEMLLAYRLEGEDKTWTVAAGTHEVEYRGLPPGSHSFELRAYSRALPDLWKSTKVSFVVPVVWYRNFWFYSIALSAIALVSLALYMLQLQRVKSRFRIVLEERTRLAREMHDTLIQGCNGVAMLFEAAASNRGQSAHKYLDLARDQLRVTVADARDAVWNLRQAETGADFFVCMLQNIATQGTESFGVPVEVQSSHNLPTVPSAAAHEVLMIVREAVTNAGSHGHPRTIGISAQHVEDQLVLRVSDDGVGFDVDAMSLPLDDHYGILGMQERAEMIGADLAITSVRGTGTCVQVSLKLTSAGAEEPLD